MIRIDCAHYDIAAHLDDVPIVSHVDDISTPIDREVEQLSTGQLAFRLSLARVDTDELIHQDPLVRAFH